MNNKYILFVFLSCHAIAANSYELATHSRITEQAYPRSNLVQDVNFLRNIGLEASSNPFGTVYFDVSGSDVRERSTQPFEIDKGRMSNVNDALTIKGWLMRGAIREDDLGFLLGIKIGPNPYDDPYGDISRVFNHFFDPYYNQALSYVPGAKKAPDWATGSSDVFNQPNTPEDGRRNHFTVFDAREAMYRALTGKKQDGTNATPNATDNDPAPEQVRKTWWATTFRALGDILHLNQDMAQPQHTRNESHSIWAAECAQPHDRRMAA